MPHNTNTMLLVALCLSMSTSPGMAETHRTLASSRNKIASAVTIKESAYVVTANTTRVVVLKVPHSGSSWFAALLNQFPRTFVKEASITKINEKHSKTAATPDAIRQHVETSLLRPTGSLRMVDSRNGGGAYSRRSNSPRAKDFDCGGCELALLGLTMCPMRAEPPYDFPRGVAAAIFQQTIKFKTIFWARTNVVKMSFATNHGSKNRTKDFVKKEPSCWKFARELGYKMAQLRALDELYDERRKVDPTLVMKVRYESMQIDEQGTLATVARFLGFDERRFLKSSRTLSSAHVPEKAASDDLRDVIANYDELHNWLAPKGVLASPCLLAMLETRRPQVFAPCPAPALVELTLPHVMVPCCV